MKSLYSDSSENNMANGVTIAGVCVKKPSYIKQKGSLNVLYSFVCILFACLLRLGLI